MSSSVRYQPIGPLLSGDGSRAVLGLALEEGVPPRPVVLVWAPPGLDAEQATWLARETQRALVFEHPNILRVHGLVELDGRLARVTDYADGETLRRILKAGQRLPPALAALVVADAAMGVHYAHLAGNEDGTPLVHGDLRPETLLVSFEGVGLVTGYGALGVAPREPNGKRVPNRRHYSAPEQLRDGREALTVQTDVFLLGLVLYECLTGKMPFQDAPDADTATLTQPLPPLPPEVPRALDAVLRKATAKAPQERHPSALALREALVEALGEPPPREALAGYLSGLFPLEGEVRKVRQQVIEIGVAQALRGPFAGAVPSLTTAAPRRPVAKPAPPKAPPAAVHEPLEEEPDAPVAPHRSRARLPVAVGGLALALAAVALLWRGEPPPPPAVAVTKPADAGAVLAAVEPPDAGAALAAVEPSDAGGAVEPSDAGAALAAVEPSDAGAVIGAGTLDGGASLAEAGAPDAGSARPGANFGTGAFLELLVEPQVTVTLKGGRVLGTTPLKMDIAPGRYTLYLNNPELGIQTARVIHLKRNQHSLHEVRLRKGFVRVRAPEGATIAVDGRDVGTAPIEELDLYEGPHRLVVTHQDEHWEKAFQLKGQKHMTFTVKFD